MWNQCKSVSSMSPSPPFVDVRRNVEAQELSGSPAWNRLLPEKDRGAALRVLHLGFRVRV